MDEGSYEDAILPADVRPSLGAFRTTGPLTEAETILLTGATGFLGRWIARELLTTSRAHLMCAVRGPAEQAAARLHDVLATTGLDVARVAGRIEIVNADLSKPSIGLDEQQFELFADRIDAVCHAGATVNWVKSYEALRSANVLGTLELLRLAARRGAAFHFVSSLSVCYSTMANRRIDERYDPLPHVAGLHLGYAQTKAVAEALVREAGQRGLPVAVYRPSLIAGHSESGAFNRDDIIARVVSGCVRMGVAPDLDWSIDCLPVDVAARHIVSTAPRAHAVHLAHRQPREWRECVLWLRLYGYDIRFAPYDDWLRQLDEETRALDARDQPLRPLRAFFLRRVPGNESRTLPELMIGSDRDFGVPEDIGPPLDAPLLQRYCDAFVASGDLPPVTPQAAHASSPSIEAEFFSRLIGREVINAEPTGRLSEDSIIGELTAWRAGQSIGIFPYALRFADRSELQIVVKIKPRDRDAIAVGQALADVCDARIGKAYARWSDRMGLTGADRREAAIYTQRDHRFVVHAPAVLGVRNDQASELTTIVLERLTNTGLSGSVDRPELWNPAAIDTAIRGLAALHSLWFDRTSTLAAQPWIGHIPSAVSVSEMSDFWNASASHARSRFLTWAGESMAPIQDRLLESVADWWTAIDEGPRTLIHNDFNPRNICLRNDPDGPRLVAYDWELATIGAPQHDLAELLCFVLTERSSRNDVHAWIERHRQLLESATGAEIDRRMWINGFRASLYDLMLNRLPMYCLIDRARRQRFLPRVVRTWRRLYQWFPLGD